MYHALKKKYSPFSVDRLKCVRGKVRYQIN